MNTQTRILPFLASLAVIASIALIVFAAIEAGALLALIFGVVLLGVVSIGLAKVGVDLFSRWSDAKVRANAARYDFLQNMASKGVLPNDGSFIAIHAQIAAPQIQQKQQKVFDFNPNDIHTAAVNYILFSRNLLGDSGNRLASAPECASAGIENYSARSWERIVKHLCNCYGVVTQPGPVANGGGVYVPDEIGKVKIGTVGNLYHHVVLNSAIEALPGVER